MARQGWEIPRGLIGEVRRTVSGARLPVDHVHEHAEFSLVLRGTGSYILDTNTYALKPGSLFWLMPEMRHRLVRTPQLEMWVVLLRRVLLDPQWIATLTAAPVHVVSGEELMDLDRLLSQVAQDSDEPATYNAGVTYAVRRAWRATRENPVGRERTIHPAVVRALFLLREDGPAAASLSALAKEAGVAAPYLSHLLIENTGRSFVEWRNRMRLDRFIRAHRGTDNLLEAATAAGFGSYAQFHRVFGEIMGCTPSDWVKQSGEDREADIVGPVPGEGGDQRVQVTPVFAARQRWLTLVSLVAPAIKDLFGRGFLDRVLDAIPLKGGEDHPPPAVAAEAVSAAGKRLITSLCTHDTVRANELAGLTRALDFATTYANILCAYGMSPHSLSDAVTAVVAIAWTAAKRANDPGIEQITSLRHQVRDALTVTPFMKGRDLSASGEEDPDLADALVALQWHFVVTYHALQAARASGDARAVEQLSSAAVAFAREAFGSDMAATVLSDDGLKRLPQEQPLKRAG